MSTSNFVSTLGGLPVTTIDKNMAILLFINLKTARQGDDLFQQSLITNIITNIVISKNIMYMYQIWYANTISIPGHY
jgi:hypothetical protein